MELTGRQFGHIRVTEVVGQGGMGDVYAGYDEKLERKVALKVLNTDQRLDDEARERLLREARALSKLDHPNICRIHDYIESAEVDLLVLEYIDGRTLSDALLERKMPRSEKLRIAVAIAEVLVTAHRAGIVHRDLKPENVMLTRTGEVKVLDFGLARWLNRARVRSSDRNAAARLNLRAVDTSAGDTMVLPPPLRHGGSTHRPELATAVGITLGTPLYMSPEQARGETLTPASDMFSFGLLLQTLFTGDEPHPLGLTAREVILRVARGETLSVQGAPGDVTALINRLKQFAPADRPTAIEAVERLRFLAERPERIVRRAVIAAVALFALLGAWRYTVDLRAERAIAVEARGEAERRRAQAEDLINFMVGDLRIKLEPVGRLDILDDVGERAIKYVEGLHPETMSADQLVRNAKALSQLGDVRAGQGKTAEALMLFRRALQLADAAVQREPKNAQALLVKGASHFWVGNGLRLQGKLDEALREMEEYQRISERLAELDPKNDEYQTERAYGHSNVATLLEQKGEFRQALEHHRVLLGIARELVSRKPDDHARQWDLAIAHNKTGVALYRLGELRDSLEHLRAETEIYRRLTAADPENMSWKQGFATNLAYHTRVLASMGRSDEAVALSDEEIALEKKLAERDPANVMWQRAVAVSERRLAEQHAKRGDTARALALYEVAQDKMREVRRMAPTRTLFIVDAAAVDQEYGSLLARTGQRSRGVTLLRKAIADLEPLGPEERGATVYRARARLLLGETLEADDPAAARQTWAAAERELQTIGASSSDPSELAVWARLLIRRGRLADARRVLDRMQTTGYDTTELVRLCRC